MAETINWQELTTEQRNRLIDEKVIKANDVKDERTIAWAGSDMLFEIAKQLIEKDDTASLPVPPYTTSMDAAWLVVECLRKNRFDTHVAAAPFQYDVSIMDRRFGGKHHTASAQSASESICVAALRTQGYIIKGVQH